MILGLTGKKGAGKDTVAEYLAGYGFQRVAFADPLKESVAALLGITREQIESWKNNDFAVVGAGLGVEDGWIIGDTMTFRHFLQRYGTEAHRDVFGQDFWLDITHERIRELLKEPGAKVVVTDVRFENEAELIRNFGGSVVEIRRPSVSVSDLHASEQLPQFDIGLWNDGTLDDLYETIEGYLDMVGFRGRTPA